MLLGIGWSNAERQSLAWFEPDVLIAASHIVEPDQPFRVDGLGGYWEDPARDASRFDLLPSDEQAAYRAAATLFHARQWAAAAASFDVVAGKVSSYRAAAAYSAARATFYAGDFGAGIRRIAALLHDPADQEMFGAAYHLLGTVTYYTDAPPLLAARLGEISHLLMAPPELRCRNIETTQLVAQADDDLMHIIHYAFPEDRRDMGPYSERRRDVFARLGRIDPVIDLVRVLAEPSAFMDRIWTDPFYPRPAGIPGLPLDDQETLSTYQDERADALAYACR